KIALSWFSTSAKLAFSPVARPDIRQAFPSIPERSGFPTLVLNGMPTVWLIFTASVLQSVAAIGVTLWLAAIPGPPLASIDNATAPLKILLKNILSFRSFAGLNVRLAK